MQFKHKTSSLIPVEWSIGNPGPPEEIRSLFLNGLPPLEILVFLLSIPNRPVLFWASKADPIPAWPKLELILVWNGGRLEPIVPPMPPMPGWEKPDKDRRHMSQENSKKQSCSIFFCKTAKPMWQWFGQAPSSGLKSQPIECWLNKSIVYLVLTHTHTHTGLHGIWGPTYHVYFVGTALNVIQLYKKKIKKIQNHNCEHFKCHNWWSNCRTMLSFNSYIHQYNNNTSLILMIRS